VAGAREICSARFPLSFLCIAFRSAFGFVFAFCFVFVFAFHDGEARGGSGTPVRGTSQAHRSPSSRVVLLSFVFPLLFFFYKIFEKRCGPNGSIGRPH
jgi:hypothetical protein